MSRVLDDLEVDLDESLEQKLRALVPSYGSHRILKQSVDARRSHQKPVLILSVEVFDLGEAPETANYDAPTVQWPAELGKPLVIGSGPCGLFAALRLAERGVPCVLIERGLPAEVRIGRINRFWRYGELDPDNNVCMGEGGAGLYSDGKLITRIKSPHIPYVMDRFVQFGAPKEIQWLSNPHVGSDKIRRVVPVMRNRLKELGVEILFGKKVVELLTDERSRSVTGVRFDSGESIESRFVVVATGHSEEHLLRQMHQAGVSVEPKSFALGLRIEHPQPLINKIQFRSAWDHPSLGSANYKLTDHDHETGVGVYSFCMCPGGYVLSSSTERDGLVTNGMSNYKRNSPHANAALVVSIDSGKRFKNLSDPFAGMDFRRELEQKAYRAVCEESPGHQHALAAQRLTDFLDGKKSQTLPKTSTPSGTASVRLDLILPKDISDRLKASINQFNRKMKGFICEDAVLFGVETRTSCPVRVTRNAETLESVSHKGLYPGGEGAGYAGGITSAACDGIRIADRLIQNSLQ